MSARAATLTVFLTLLVGCKSGEYAQRVPQKLLAELPYPARVELLDQESDVADTVQLAAENEAEGARLQQMLEKAEARKGGTSEESGQEGNNIAELAAHEAQARVDYLKGELADNERRKQILGLQYRCRIARFEVAKLRQAQRANLPAVKAVHLDDFEQQAQSCEEELVELRQRCALQAEPVRAAKQRWQDFRDSLQAASELQPSPYVQ